MKSCSGSAVLVGLDDLNVESRLDCGEGASRGAVGAVRIEACRSWVVCGGKRFGHGLSRTGAPPAASDTCSDCTPRLLYLPLRR